MLLNDKPYTNLNELIEFYIKYQDFFKLALTDQKLFKEQVIDANEDYANLNHDFKEVFYSIGKKLPSRIYRGDNLTKQYFQALCGPDFDYVHGTGTLGGIFVGDDATLKAFFKAHKEIFEFLIDNAELLHEAAGAWYDDFAADVIKQNKTFWHDISSGKDLAAIANQVAAPFKKSKDGKYSEEDLEVLAKAIQLAMRDIKMEVSFCMSHQSYVEYVSHIINECVEDVLNVPSESETEIEAKFSSASDEDLSDPDGKEEVSSTEDEELAAPQEPALQFERWQTQSATTPATDSFPFFTADPEENKDVNKHKKRQQLTSPADETKDTPADEMKDESYQTKIKKTKS